MLWRELFGDRHARVAVPGGGEVGFLSARATNGRAVAANQHVFQSVLLIPEIAFRVVQLRQLVNRLLHGFRRMPFHQSPEYGCVHKSGRHTHCARLRAELVTFSRGNYFERFTAKKERRLALVL